ncbi:MAG: transporter substrate-binding domain-containing protein [Deltaproteobacteria bacterium]|nr:transporter substrate-binding domain-containing protein [Deltaproteobacteria bacterium]
MKIIILFMTLLCIATFAHADDSIRLMTEEFPPYQFYEGEGENRVITGISIEIIKAVQKKIGNSDPIKVYPWSRGLKLLAKHKNSALFSTVRTPGRESQYKWVGPLAKLDMVFFKRTGSELNVHSIEDAKKISKIGVTKNVATHEILLNHGFTNLDVLQSGADDNNLKRLIKGRVDAWPTSYYAGIYNARKDGVLDQVEVIKDVSIMSGHLYVAFNKETDDQIIHQWQAALDLLTSDGVIDGIMSKYER